MQNPMCIDLPVSTVLSYVPDHKYLDVATVSKLFRAKYAPKAVTAIANDTSTNNLAEYFENGMPISDHVPTKAAEMGRLDLFQVAIGRGCTISHKTTRVAANLGHLHILQYIGYWNLCHQCVCAGASMGGKLNVLKWLLPEKRWLQDQISTSKIVMRNAVAGGFLPIVAWAYNKGVTLDHTHLNTAATYGHFEIVKYIHHAQRSVKYPSSVILHAALRGDLPTLAWLNKKGYPWSDTICVLLARKGNLGALRYARNHGCPWGMLTIGSVRTIIEGDMLAYLVDTGCPLS